MGRCAVGNGLLGFFHVVTCAGDVVCVHVCVQHKLEVETQLTYKTHVPLGLSSMSLFIEVNDQTQNEERSRQTHDDCRLTCSITGSIRMASLATMSANR